MAITLEFGKKILMKRILQMLEKENYRVEYADEYGGYIVADKREDPNIFLLTQNTIDDFRAKNPGKPAAFLEAVLTEVKNNVNAAATSIPPGAGEMQQEPMADEMAMVEEVPPSPEPVDELEVLEVEEVPDLQPMPEDDLPVASSQGEDSPDAEHMVPVAETSDDIEEISSIIPEDDPKDE